LTPAIFRASRHLRALILDRGCVELGVDLAQCLVNIDLRAGKIKTASVTPEGHRVVEAINAGPAAATRRSFRRLEQEPIKATLARLTRRLSDAMFALIEAQGASPHKCRQTRRH
jgi:hypothetical protein